MKKVVLLLGVFAAMFAFTSCDDNDELLPTDDPKDPYAAELVLEDMADTTITVYASDIDSTAFEVLVTFKSTGKNMRRLYMTQNIAGAGSEPYVLNMDDLDLKGDGSLDIESKQGDEFTFVLPFPILSSLAEGTVEYQLWATSGRGDYRDSDNSLTVGVGTIIVNYGGSNPATAVKEYSAKLLAAPLADGSSSTFISLLDGQIYKINEGEEYVAFWDFGYYYGASNKASLASTNDYPSTVINIPEIANTTAELNHTYFALSDKTSTDFDAVTSANDLEFISTSTSETIKNISVNDIIEFVDNYGKKGLIRVEKINGTWNSGDYIELDIKIQP